MADGDTQPTNEPNWQQFIDGLNRLNENVTDLKGKMAAPSVEDIDDEPQAPSAPETINFPEGFDDMSARQQFDWMLKTFGERFTTQVVAQVQEIVKPALDRQQKQEQGLLEEKYTREITGLMEEKGPDGKLLRPDFQDWGQEMVAIVKENPGITPIRAYNLARAENPKKAGELNTKYNPPPPPKPSPFSFAPSSGGTSAPGSSPKPPDKTEAFNNAMEKVKAKWGHEFALGQREF